MNFANAWKQYFFSLQGNDKGDQTCSRTAKVMSSERSLEQKLVSLVEDVDSVIFMVDRNKMTTVVHIAPRTLEAQGLAPQKKPPSLLEWDLDQHASF